MTPSSQGGGVPAVQPVAGSPFAGSHASTPLQKSASTHLVSSGVCVHAFAFSSHASLVQETPSSQLGGAPAMQPCVASQISAPSQKTPSSHIVASGVCAHAFAVSSQASTVHATPSSQLGAAPATQPVVASPFAGSHVSAPLQYTPSSHWVSSGVLAQLLFASSQVSTVHDRWSSHGGAPATHAPATHVSAPLQYAPSSHCASLVHMAVPLLDDVLVPPPAPLLDDVLVPPPAPLLDDVLVPPPAPVVVVALQRLTLLF
jgi:hypothetical protein